MSLTKQAEHAVKDAAQARKQKYKNRERAAVRAVGLCLMAENRRNGRHYTKAQEKALRGTA